MSSNLEHIAVVSALFDRKAEGMCTGRLVRALLDAGIRVSLVTSSKANLNFEHPNLRVLKYPVQPRDPKGLFRNYAKLSDGLNCNMYVWSRRAVRAEFQERPDLVYARAWPDSSLMAGYRIAEKHDLPLWIHFSDPFPPPGEPPLTKTRRADLQRVSNRANVCTFTNEKTVGYQSRFLDFPHPQWAQVLPHVSPDPIRLADRPRAHRFGYVGTFSAQRDPRMLMEAFRLYRESVPAARYIFVGPGHQMLRDRISELGLIESVEYRSYAEDNREHMADMDVLVGLDNLHDEPLYSLTKTAEYLTVDRPVLHVVQEQSPDYALISQVGETATAIPPGSPESICAAMHTCHEIPSKPELYEGRFKVMRALGAPAIAQRFLELYASAQR